MTLGFWNMTRRLIYVFQRFLVILFVLIYYFKALFLVEKRLVKGVDYWTALCFIVLNFDVSEVEYNDTTLILV